MTEDLIELYVESGESILQIAERAKLVSTENNKQVTFSFNFKNIIVEPTSQLSDIIIQYDNNISDRDLRNILKWRSNP